MSTNKIIGWFLLFLGVAVISYGLYSSFNIFTAREAVPEIFSFPTYQTEEKEIESEDLEAQMEEIIGRQLKEIIPIDFLSKLLNLLCYSLLAGILIFGGSKIGGLGIRLIKE